MPVHSGMLSSHLCFCLPLLLPPGTVPCRIVLASPEDLVTCPSHFSLRRLLWSRSFRWVQCMPSSVSNLFVGVVVSVGDTEKLSEASHLHGLYPSLCVCCYCPRLRGISEYGHDQGAYKCDLWAERYIQHRQNFIIATPGRTLLFACVIFKHVPLCFCHNENLPWDHVFRRNAQKQHVFDIHFYRLTMFLLH